MTAKMFSSVYISGSLGRAVLWQEEKPYIIDAHAPELLRDPAQNELSNFFNIALELRKIDVAGQPVSEDYIRHQLLRDTRQCAALDGLLVGMDPDFEDGVRERAIEVAEGNIVVFPLVMRFVRARFLRPVDRQEWDVEGALRIARRLGAEAVSGLYATLADASLKSIFDEMVGLVSKQKGDGAEGFALREMLIENGIVGELAAAGGNLANLRELLESSVSRAEQIEPDGAEVIRKLITQRLSDLEEAHREKSRSMELGWARSANRVVRYSSVGVLSANAPVLVMDSVEVIGGHDHEEFRRAVLNGLSTTPRAIPARFLYDARGSALFDEICELPEYYLTRTETKILEQHAGEIGRRAGPGCALVEFGSGSSVKSRLLIDALPQLALYAPIDISREHLDATAARLRRDYPGLRVEPVCADFMGPVPPIDHAARRLGFFPGSTIGSLQPAEATAFLRNARRLLGDDGALVLGVDLKKDPQRLHDAYNDSAGVTAAFTLNLLRRMNRELHATFDLAGFAHEAFYNPVEGRIEIYFRSLRDQSVMVAGRRFDFVEGERVHTEYSYKYDAAGIDALARSGGFRIAETWTDPARLFAVAYLEATPS